MDSRFPIRVLAPNPGPFTLEGTNTWIVGGERTIVVDPGPEDAAHLDEVLRSAGSIACIAVTHRHPDHVPGAARLAAAAGAPVYTFDPADGERRMHDGDVLRADGVELSVVHSPGHTPDHVVLFDQANGWMFTGDAVLGRGTSVIDPPEGDLADYLDSLRRMRSLGPRVLCPGHGPVVWDAEAKLTEYLDHRAERERQVVEALDAAGSASPMDLVPVIYADYPVEIHPAAARSVLAHLLALERTGRVVGDPADPDRFASTPVDTAGAGGAADDVEDHDQSPPARPAAARRRRASSSTGSKPAAKRAASRSPAADTPSEPPASSGGANTV
jgi:glyoxylase-like metal-dependent hydrolase (beta-lactamase superfamily II)